MKKITFFVLGPMLIAGLWASPKHSEQDRTHPATVVDWDSKSPLADVWATAYETNQIETIDDCPVYKGKITSDKSDKYGKLSLAVPVKLSDYYVQYCRQDYGGRRTHNKNEPNGKRIVPDPVRICKKGKSSVEVQRRRIQEVSSDVDSGRLDKSIAGQELAYLREIDAAGYDTALGQDQNLTVNARDFGGPFPSSLAQGQEPESFWKTLFKNMWSFFRRH